VDRVCPSAREDLLKVTAEIISPVRDSLFHFAWSLEGRFNAVRAPRKGRLAGAIQVVESGFDALDTLMIEGLDQRVPDWRERLLEVEGAIRAWGQRWNLNDEWLLAVAFHALDKPAKPFELPLVFGLTEAVVPPPEEGGEDDALKHLLIKRVSEALDSGVHLPAEDTGRSREDHAAVRRGLSPWLPGTSESRSDARSRMLDALERVVEEHLTRMQELAREQGFRPPLEKRSRVKAKRSPDVHFEWLARFQVSGETQSDIRKSIRKERPDLQSVRKAISKTAEECRVTRRGK